MTQHGHVVLQCLADIATPGEIRFIVLLVPRWNLKRMSLILAELNEASRLLVEVSCMRSLLVEANRKSLLAEEDRMCLLLVDVKS